MDVLSELKVGVKLEILPRENSEDNDYTIVSQVIDVKEGSVFIINPIKQGASYPLYPGQRIRIIFNREDKGIFRFVAEVKKKINKNLTTYEITPIGEAEKIQRRYYYRLDIVRKVLIELRDEPIQIEGVTKDISGGGVKVYTKEPLPIGCRIDCKIFLHDDSKEIIDVAGEVIRCFKDPQKNEFVVGISYRGIQEPVRSKIISFIFERQRLLRKKGLI
ncbi:flagellar brake protein [Alkaliphilus transvaalensis]|uniref:flagellar brake protein n=1 Tax=Alkaliphilus transvaalensis TaxID=114628 RepID=UPI00047D943B|nr:PilZ domain-containing protein [Alkaliphilus transvaalensis]